MVTNTGTYGQVCVFLELKRVPSGRLLGIGETKCPLGKRFKEPTMTICFISPGERELSQHDTCLPDVCEPEEPSAAVPASPVPGPHRVGGVLE